MISISFTRSRRDAENRVLENASASLCLCVKNKVWYGVAKRTAVAVVMLASTAISAEAKRLVVGDAPPRGGSSRRRSCRSAPGPSPTWATTTVRASSNRSASASRSTERGRCRIRRRRRSSRSVPARTSRFCRSASRRSARRFREARRGRRPPPPNPPVPDLPVFAGIRRDFGEFLRLADGHGCDVVAGGPAWMLATSPACFAHVKNGNSSIVVLAVAPGDVPEPARPALARVWCTILANLDVETPAGP